MDLLSASCLCLWSAEAPSLLKYSVSFDYLKQHRLLNMVNANAGFLLVKMARILAVLAAILQVNEALLAYDALPKRVGNRKRRRNDCLQHLSDFNDQEFKAQTGLSRLCFNYILSLIEPQITSNAQKAVNSSGSAVPAAMKLFVHMRLLKGAKSLDTEWMGVDPGHVWTAVWLPVATAIDAALDNVRFDAADPEWCAQRASEWSLVQKRKYGANPCKGLIGARVLC